MPSDEELAEALIAAAAKATGAVGAAGGALAAVQFTATPSLITTPVQLAAETLLVAVIEMKLIAELHEVYGAGVGGTARQRAMAYLVAWTNRRGIDPLDPAAMQLALGVAAKRGLRKRLIRRARPQPEHAGTDDDRRDRGQRRQPPRDPTRRLGGPRRPAPLTGQPC